MFETSQRVKVTKVEGKIRNGVAQIKNRRTIQ